MAYGGEAVSSTRPSRSGVNYKDAVCTGIRTSRSDNGGFVADCNYESTSRSKSGLGSSYIPSRQLTYSTFDELVAGMREVWGIKASPKGK